MAGATPTEQITVRCACGTKLKAPSSAVGRKAKCPKCGAVLTIQPPAAAAAAEPEPVALGDDDELGSSSQQPAEEDDLYGLADDPQPAARRGSVAVPPPPPPVPMGGPIGAVRPLDAGGGIPMGTPVGLGGVGGLSPYPPPIRTSVQVQNPEAKPVEGGSFFKGLGLSIALAFVGSLVWFGIAAATHRELGWIALGVGFLAGLGMAMGYGSHNALSGLTASVIAVLAIIVGKLMVFVFVLMPMFDRMADADDPEGARDRVLYHLTDEDLASRGIDTDEPPDREWERSEKTAEKKVDAMSEAEIQQMDEKIRADWDKEELTELTMIEAYEQKGLDYADTTDEQDAVARKEAETRLATMTPEQRKAELERLRTASEADAGLDDEELEGIGRTVSIIAYTVLFFVTCFGLMDIIFMLFAIASAFKVATSGTET
jgi:hypothetical protein